VGLLEACINLKYLAIGISDGVTLAMPYLKGELNGQIHIWSDSVNLRNYSIY
jgi:hypothetical protein